MHFWRNYNLSQYKYAAHTLLQALSILMLALVFLQTNVDVKLKRKTCRKVPLSAFVFLKFVNSKSLFPTCCTPFLQAPVAYQTKSTEWDLIFEGPVNDFRKKQTS